MMPSRRPRTSRTARRRRIVKVRLELGRDLQVVLTCSEMCQDLENALKKLQNDEKYLKAWP